MAPEMTLGPEAYLPICSDQQDQMVLFLGRECFYDHSSWRSTVDPSGLPDIGKPVSTISPVMSEWNSLDTTGPEHPNGVQKAQPRARRLADTGSRVQTSLSCLGCPTW